MATINLASKYAKKVDERFTKQSQASLVTNNNYDFTGVETVNVFSIPTVDLNQYGEDTNHRYGSPEELGNSVQAMKVEQDLAWTFVIDKKNKIQSQMVMDAGKACARQMSEVIIPVYDKYVFETLAIAACGYEVGEEGAKEKINCSIETIDLKKDTSAKAYEAFLKGQEVLGDAHVPDSGRVCLCSYAFANKLKLDPSFIRYGDLSQEMLLKGVMGEVDGVKIVKVPKSRLPQGCNFILTHPIACVAPRQLNEYKIHTDPVGVSGWICEGRQLFDAFVLENKKSAIYYNGESEVTAYTAKNKAGKALFKAKTA